MTSKENLFVRGIIKEKSPKIKNRELNLLEFLADQME